MDLFVAVITGILKFSSVLEASETGDIVVSNSFSATKTGNIFSCVFVVSADLHFFASDRVVFVTLTNVDFAVAMEEITLLTLVA